MKYPQGIKPIGANQWHVRATKQQNGKRRSAERQVSGGLADAKAAKLELEAELETRLVQTARPERPTLTVLAQRWLEALAAEPDETRLTNHLKIPWRQSEAWSRW